MKLCSFQENGGQVEMIILPELGKAQKEKYWMFSFICESDIFRYTTSHIHEMKITFSDESGTST